MLRRSCTFAVLFTLSMASHAGAQDAGTARGVGTVRRANPATGKTYALLIGISHYQKVSPLEYADKDAELLADFLKSPRGGVDPENILLLTNERATRAAIDDAVKNFVEPHASPENSLVFFIAGHGVYLKEEVVPLAKRTITSNPWILTVDSNPEDPNTTGLPMDEFRGMVFDQALRYGRVLVYADVCHADNIAGMGGGSELQPSVAKVLGGGPGAGDLDLLVASAQDKYAYESPAFGGGHGAFSYFLVSGLNGSAAFPGEDTVRWNELAHYVYDRVYTYTVGKQSTKEKATNSDLVVVPDLRPDGIVLPPAQPLTKDQQREARERQGYIPPVLATQPGAVQDATDELSKAIARGALLPEDPASAFGTLPQFPAGSPQRIQAERQLHVALEDQGQQIVSRYLEGDQIPQNREDFLRCARLFEEAFRLAPTVSFDQSRALFCRGRALIFERRYQDAEPLLRQSIQLDPKRGYAWNAIGISRLEQINNTLTAQAAIPLFDDAAGAFQNAIRYAPYWAYPLHNLALTLSERGDFDGAIRTYKLAMDIAPQYSYLPYNLGLLYIRIGDLPEARRWFESAEKIAVAYPRKQNGRWTERADALNALGTLALERHDSAGARRYFDAALADDALNPNARQNLALLAAANKDYARADRIWLDLMKDSPDYIAAPVARAESLALRGDKAGAIRQYREILIAKPDWTGAHEALARLYFSTGDSENALSEVNAALGRTPSSPFLLELRGDIDFLLKRRGEALIDWNNALRIAPDKTAASRLKGKLKHPESS